MVSVLHDLVRGGRLPRVLCAFAVFSVVEYAAWIAVLLVAYDLGGAQLAAIVGVVQLVPAALLAPALGSLGDRFPRGTALAVSYLVEAAFLGLTAVLLWNGAPVVAVVAASTMATLTVSVARPVHFAVLPQLVRTPGQLVRANSASGVLEGAGVFVGPVLAGVLSEWAGASATLAFCSAVMLVAAMLMIRLRVPVAQRREQQSRLLEAVAGLREVGRDRGVLALLLLLGTSFVVVGALEILVLSFSDVVLGAGESAAGLLLSAYGLGGLIGAAVAAGLALRTRLEPPVVWSLVGAGLPLVAMAVSASLPAAALLVAVCGFGQAVAGVAARTLLQRGTDDRLLARVFGVQEAVMLIGLAVGAALAPLLIAWFGAASGFVPLGVGLIVVALLARPWIARFDRVASFRPNVVRRLREVAFLAGLAPPPLQRLARNCTWIDAAQGDLVIRQGDVGDAFYVVESGRLAVTVDGALREHTLGAADGFGEIALLHDVPRTATITALEPTRMLRVERDDFLAAITGSPDGRVVADRVAEAYPELERDLPPS